MHRIGGNERMQHAVFIDIQTDNVRSKAVICSAIVVRGLDDFGNGHGDLM